jgi:hypothetical protein
MTYSKAFFDLQLHFARKVADLGALPFEQALLDYTNLYVRFGLGRKFDCNHPVWREYLEGLPRAADIDDWTHRFYLTRPHDVPPPSLIATSGCFSYAKTDDERIRLHFLNAGTSKHSPPGEACLATRFAELRVLFQHARQTQPATLQVAGVSWLYHLHGYRRLFPASYLASAKPASPRFRNMPLWGQFLDRHGDVRQSVAATFVERLAHQTRLNDIAQCFPLQPLALEAPHPSRTSTISTARRYASEKASTLSVVHNVTALRPSFKHVATVLDQDRSRRFGGSCRPGPRGRERLFRGLRSCLIDDGQPARELSLPGRIGHIRVKMNARLVSGEMIGHRSLVVAYA